ncbi:MAG: hypothetical protein E7080_06820 [Bacteroidales bacterium]|nr:hypothetical protein [Bacteroidales bacterium]
MKMRKIGKKMLALVLAMSFLPVFAAESYVNMKHEMRSTWLTTVWGIDWPSTQGSSESAITSQKNQMIKILDSLAVNNFNSVCFQVRTMSDAFYKSSYEPWSNWLTGTRGKDPGWDPLKFVVDECHKRGMECLAWVNPYRFASESSAWINGGDGTNYVENGWIIDANSGTKILNPGKPEVIEHIIKVLEEIVVGYDIDGMLFDDYYYNSASDSGDAADYTAYKSAGGTMSKADWRRNNVHTFIKGVFDMIQKHKPWVRFGQAPPGTTYTSASMASKYGLEACPCGYELCYSSQYVDILRLLDEGVIDFISPQVYWAIGSSPSDYSKIVPWWGKVSKRFNRHLFVAQTIQYLNNSTGKMGTFAEFYDQTMINRRTAQLGSAGSIYYSQKYIYQKQGGQTFGNYLKAKAYQKPAIMPAMDWKTANNPGKVENLNYDDAGNLTWTAKENMRYTVYAVPSGVEPTAFAKEQDYLLGVSYNNAYIIPENYRSGYYFAVCAYDRYGNEWDAAVWKPVYTETLSNPTLVSPATGFVTDKSFDFKWNTVSGAEKYALDIATDAQFLNIEKSVQTTGTSVSVNEVYNSISKNKTLYWQVRAIAKGKNDGKSDSRTFEYKLVQMLTPENDADGLDPKVNFTWSVTTEGAPITLQVAEDMNFEKMVFSVESTTGNYQTKVYELHPLMTYYARVVQDGKASDYVKFSTKAMPCSAPTFKFPLNGGVCYSNSMVEINPQDGAEVVVIQVDKTNAFGGSKSQKKTEDYATGVPSSEFLLSRKNPMEDGVTYYARAQVQYYDENGTFCTSDWGETISFVYSSSASAIDKVETDAKVKIAGENVVVTAGNVVDVQVNAVSMLGNVAKLYAGKTAHEEISLSELRNGLYVIQVAVDGEFYTMKYIKK